MYINLTDIDFIKYLPVITSIITATLGYMFGGRSKRNDALVQSTKESLEKAFNPIYHEIEFEIKGAENSTQREKMLDKFFKKYTSNTTIIYKLGNSKLIDEFYELSHKYKSFKSLRDENLWKDFWYEFENNFFLKIKEGYKNSINLLHRDLNWQQYVQAKPYWQKFYFETMKFLFDTVKGINIALLLTVYFSGCFKLFGLDLFPSSFWEASVVLLIVSLCLTGFLMMLNVQYLTLSSNSREGFTRKIMKKVMPRTLKWWDNLFLKREYDKVPKMYDKKTFED